VNVRLWGTRGSLPTPGASTQGYGGNTSCVEVTTGQADHVTVLDAGSGIRNLGAALAPPIQRVDVLLTHLRMDHIIGLGFFAALRNPELEVHLWGPASTTLALSERLTRYLSPPLFPVRLRDLPCRLTLHDVPLGAFELPDMEVRAGLVCHPGPTVGYRIHDGTATLTYLPDHEPALGARHFPEPSAWTSGYDLAADADLLIHDAQYTPLEYDEHVGWGHSSLAHARAFASHTGARHLIAFHHDPAHDDDCLEHMYAQDAEHAGGSPRITAAREGDTFATSPAPDHAHQPRL
jgi:phosphoribosyl 1,2-cyclic phosphodiesterase